MMACGTRKILEFQLWILYTLCFTFKCLNAEAMPSPQCYLSKEGFVRLKYDPPTKSSVTLRWQIDCAFQDAGSIVTGYNISYCPIDHTISECDKSVGKKHILISDPNQMYVTIANLDSFTTYLFNLSVITELGEKNIEDNNNKAVVTTPEDAPSRPRNVQISNVTRDSFEISWDPPQRRNGVITKYVIRNYDEVVYVDKVKAFGTYTSKRRITLTGIPEFTDSVTVQACNIDLCSKRAVSSRRA